jgi:cell division septal protein FtsQ
MKDYAPQLNRKLKTLEREARAKEIFALIGMGTVVLLVVRGIIWVAWFLSYVYA